MHTNQKQIKNTKNKGMSRAAKERMQKTNEKAKNEAEQAEREA